MVLSVDNPIREVFRMDLTSVILVSVSLVVVLCLTYGIRKIKSMKIVDFIQKLEKSKHIIDLIDGATHNLMRIDPEKQKVVDIIVQYSKIAVDSVEQMYLSGDIPKDARKEKAKEIVNLALANAGVSLTVGQDKLIDYTIEAMVFLLPDTKQ